MSNQLCAFDPNRHIGCDLIYADAVHKAEIAAAFPNATFEDARDEVHRERFEVKLPVGTTVSNWYRFLLRAGLYPASLHWGLDATMPPAGLLEWVKSLPAR